MPRLAGYSQIRERNQDMATGSEYARASFGKPDFDVVVVGAGFAGLYLLYKLRESGFSAKVLEAAGDVGGTWYWNRYPGARCDIISIDYSYSFDPELETEWRWSEKYATQPEILRYLQHVAAKHDLRRDIAFETGVESACWDDDSAWWLIRTDKGGEITCRYYVMATGCLSKPKAPDIEGCGRFLGEVYYTSRWPHEGADFTGKRVALIGTGSSGIQSIPLIAAQAKQLTVFQRTPNFSIPAHNGPIPAHRLAEYECDRAGYRERARWSRIGVPFQLVEIGAMQVSEEERQARYEAMWEAGELVGIGLAFNDIIVNPESNETLCEFIRGKIRSIVKNPETADALCPKDHYVGTKRPCLDTNYYKTYNLDHVRLVDLRKTPIATITETGIDTVGESFEFDAIVYATGFDAMTGPIVAVKITGRDGVTLRDKWADGPLTYLGLMTTGFPNFFAVTGPGSPSVLSNMTVSIEQHVDWICDCLKDLREENLEVIEPTAAAEAGWVQHVNDCANITLYPTANSWYMGANVPGKPRVFLPYIGGVDSYRAACNEVVERDYLGFVRSGPGQRRVNDGVIRRLQPDVQMMLETLAALNLPPMEEMSPEGARAFSRELSAVRPPGPEVGEIVDGMLPGAEGDLDYRLYRPATAGPHPVVVYFHGGGWVLGSHDSDDPFCRDMCVRSNAVFVSVNYRHAPEHRFPAAAEDAFAAVQWIADHLEMMGGVPGQLAVCGWSAGGNLAAVVCQMARAAGGPDICGQVLVTPVTDCDFSRPSYTENGADYVLTKPLMRWFWDHYADPADRINPKASPLRVNNLSGLPQALVVTSEFDPLRDEGAAYADAMAAAGVKVRHLPCRGQIHTSLMAVDIILSSAGARAEISASLRQFFHQNEAT
jgi:cation diffusion facilitator CzcD-associated flavoprotein CzcO/acetyl esterase/lipase